jgi:homogentisate 1,2-dioxygenase
MIETRNIIKPTRAAMESPQLQADYFQCWQGIKKNFNPEQA